MDTRCIPQTTKVGCRLGLRINDQNGAKRNSGDFFFDSQRKVYSRCAGSGCWEAQVVVVSGRARVRIVTTLTRWFDFFKIIIPRFIVARNIQFDLIHFGAPDILGKMIQLDEHTFQVG